MSRIPRTHITSSTHTKCIGLFVREVMNRGKWETGDMAYLSPGSQQEVVEEGGGCRESTIPVTGPTQGLKVDENGAHVDRVSDG